MQSIVLKDRSYGVDHYADVSQLIPRQDSGSNHVAQEI